MEKLTVLVADDDARIRLLLSLNLTKRDWVVYQAENGRQAIEYLKHDKPDVLILDLGMPEVSGYDVCHWVRQHDLDVPILVLTAYTEGDSKRHALEAGADDFATKPFKIDDILVKLNHLVKHH